jgi:Leucine-rich repeat (LRR) protein
MWSSFFIFVLLLLSAHSGHGVVLDKNQLAVWYPNYLTAFEFNLNYRQITSISSGTFTGLSQLQRLYLYNNQLTSLDASIFNGLSQFENCTCALISSLH